MMHDPGWESATEMLPASLTDFTAEIHCDM